MSRVSKRKGSLLFGLSEIGFAKILNIVAMVALMANLAEWRRRRRRSRVGNRFPILAAAAAACVQFGLVRHPPPPLLRHRAPLCHQGNGGTDGLKRVMNKLNLIYGRSRLRKVIRM